MGRELKYVLRRLMRAPMFTAVTLITLAIGIGANTAIFSVVHGVLLKPLPHPDADRLVSVWHTAPGINLKDLNASPSTYFTYREESQTFQSIGMWNRGLATITGIAEPEEIPTLLVTEETLPILGAQPALGRGFTASDTAPGAPQTALLTHGYWQSRFGGDRSILGRRVLVNSHPFEVIGVLPERFRFMNFRPSMVLPLRFKRSEVFVGNFSFQSLAKLKPGATVAQANADVARMLPMMMQKFPAAGGLSLKLLEDAKIGPNVRSLKQEVVGDVGKVLWVLLATIGMVLFIACANVANLLLVRAEGRQQELAIRSALGASWQRVARELLFESVTLGLAGGVLGVAVAYGAIRLLVAIGPPTLPRLDEISIDPVVLLFTLAISTAAGLLFGLIPVWKYAVPHLGMALRAGGRTMSDSRERHRTRGALVVVQVALALLLLIGSGLMMRTLQALRNVDPGFTGPDEILTLRISIPGAQVPQPESVARMHHAILQKISDIPGVTSAGLSNSITMDGANNNDPIFAEGRNDGGSLPPIRRYKHLSPGFLQTMGQPVRYGRDLTWTDVHEARPVALISENLARELWTDPAAAVGKRIRENPKGMWREVIGVVGNERDNGVDQKAPTIVYWPLMVKDFWGQPLAVRRTLAIAIRSPRTGSAGYLEEIRKAVWSVDPSLPLANIRTVREIADRSMARTSFTMVMLSIAAGMALLLGIVGIYGVISYSVSQRTREIGIRIALGASQNKITRMFVGNGLLLVLTGVACGLAAAVPLSRLMSALLFEVSPMDPITYGAVSGILILAALLATYIPTRRAAAVEPLTALRAE